MKSAIVLLSLMLALFAKPARADYAFSVHPAPIYPGQPVFLRIDETDRCFEYGGYGVKRNGNTVSIEIIGSDHILHPCLPHDTTPIFLPLGNFEAGTYVVEAYVCGNFPVDPCGEPTLLGFQVGGPLQRQTIPVFGWIALLMSCSGILALAFTTRRAAPPP